MWFEVTEAPLDWEAPAGEALTAELAMPADAVWDQLIADPASWLKWFPGFAEAHWHGDARACVGATRDVRLKDGMIVREKIAAWEPGRRFAFSIVGTNRPLIRRMTEDYRFEPTATGCRFAWTVKYELAWWLRPLGGVVRRQFRPMFDEATAGLVRATGG